MPTDSEPQKRISLSGLYMSDKLSNVNLMSGTYQDDFLEQDLRQTIIVYSNGTLARQIVTINRITDKGYILTKGEPTTLSYVANNETRTMIVRGLTNNTSFSYNYSEDFNTIIDNNNITFKYYSGTLEENIEGENIGEMQRDEGLEGTFIQENGKVSFSFNRNGTFSDNKYGSLGNLNTSYFFMDNNNIKMYMGYNFYYEGVLSDDKTKLTITKAVNPSGEMRDYTKKENGSNTFILQK